MTFFWIFLGFLAALLIILTVKRTLSFRAQKPADYDGPLSFDVRRALSGPLLCEGVIYGPTGRVASRFCAEMEGHWMGTKGR